MDEFPKFKKSSGKSKKSKKKGSPTKSDAPFYGKFVKNKTSKSPKTDKASPKGKEQSSLPSYDDKINKLEETKAGKKPADKANKEPIRLNRYISNSGICSRRAADELILKGEVSVNGKVITQLGTKVLPKDEVSYKGQILNREQKVYLLLNKPNGFITTMEDPKGRKTVMDLVSNACEERIYPVGRLDRETTGLLLFTNDGELAKKMTHPSGKVKKIYSVELDRPFELDDFEKLTSGTLELEDGKVDLDGVSMISDDGTKLGVQLHSGKNRIVRRVFESMGYQIVKLDRTVYSELTKKDIPRGKWRFLSQKEVITLKYFTGKN